MHNKYSKSKAQQNMQKQYEVAQGYQPQFSSVISQPIAFMHDIYVDVDLVEPSDWRYELSTIRNAGPDDIVHLRINCQGGSDLVMGAFVKAITESQARIVGHLDHLCASAATIIFLACHEYVISDGAEFMVHTASLGYGGKQNNFNEYAMFINKTNERLIRKYYKNFLTEEEIKDVLKGTDLWMDAEEVISRLQKRASLEQEQDDNAFTREKALAMSHEELVDMIFPECDCEECLLERELNKESVETEPKEEREDVSYVEIGKYITYYHEPDIDWITFEYMDTIVECNHMDLSVDTLKQSVMFSTNSLKQICDDLEIKYTKNNNFNQLASFHAMRRASAINSIALYPLSFSASLAISHALFITFIIFGSPFNLFP